MDGDFRRAAKLPHDVQYGRHHAIWQPAPPPRCMHRRIEIDWALSKITPKAVPAAPLGLLARQCHADADVDTAAAIVAPTNIATRKRLMITSLMFMHEIPAYHAATLQPRKLLVVFDFLPGFRRFRP
jgi:hypothetical protein